MTQRTQIIVAAVAGFGVAALLALIAAAIIANQLRPTNTVVWQTCQPDSVMYDDFDPYCLSVVEGAADMQFVPFRMGRVHYLFVGRGTGAPSYGHYVAYTPQYVHFAPADLADYLTEAAVEWEADGLTFVEPSGHRLYIPAEMFTGGR
jgi:hypothetical protein